ncbi:MAG: tetratricopeptide repeat-containing sensor histidine kinase [Bacteroidales bacterium]|nr:tetratricopeptide repeat-containing sensor histidine kinase [Bacteroidales bacterium]
MPKFWICTVWFCLIARTTVFIAVANDDFDSLRRVMTTLATDTAKVNFCYKAVQPEILRPQKDYDALLAFAKEGVELAKSARYTKGEAELTRAIGVCYFYSSDYTTANLWFHNALDLCKNINDIDGAAKNYYNIGQCFFILSKYHDALDNFLIALSLKKEAKGYVLDVYGVIAITYNELKEFSKAEEYNLEALDIAQKQGVINESVMSLIRNTAINYGNWHDTVKATFYYDRAIEIARQVGDKVTEATSIIDRADMNPEDKQQRIQSLVKASQLCAECTQTHHAFPLAKLYKIIATHYDDLNMPDSSEFYIKKSIAPSSLSLQSNNKIILTDNCLNAVNLYFKHKKYSKAHEMCELALSVATDNGFENMQADALKWLRRIYAIEGNYRKANEITEKYDILKDSIDIKTTREKISQIKQQFEFEQHRQTKLQSQENALIREHQRNIWLMIVIALAVITVVIIALSRKRLKKANAIISSQNAQLTDLVKFKQDVTGMIVHDLKNPLNVIINLTRSVPEGKRLLLVHESAQRMLNLVLNILDINKYEDKKLEIHRRDIYLNELIAEVMAGMKLSMDSKQLQFSWEPQDKIMLSIDCDLVRRVLDNLIVNAIKFSPPAETIGIEAEKIDSEVRISVSNIGSSIPPDMQEAIFAPYGRINREENNGGAKSTGLGLTFCKMAVEAHGGKIGVVSGEGKPTCFWFSLPV